MFRKDINGLRAIAAILVVFYHFKIGFFSGGYIGVDIFFVISGYLMNEICTKSYGNKGWILAFYKKRLDRIYPPLLFTVTITTIISIIFLPPSFLHDIKNQTLNALLFTSNVYYWKSTSGYFSSIADSYILLHTWSLGLEFQFYLIFPLALIIANSSLFKNKSYLFYGLACLSSFILCILVSRNNPSAAFYMLPTRAWELFLGAFASSLSFKNPIPKASQHIAILTIMAFCIFGTHDILWPSEFTLVPTLATAILLHAKLDNNESTVRFYPIQVLGSASYSIYLVHWPILSIAYNVGVTLDVKTKIILSATSIIMGILSYQLIEKKYKKFNLKVAFTSISAILLCVIISQLQISKHWTSEDVLAMDKFNREYENTEQGQLQFGSKPYKCFYTGKKEDQYDLENCFKLDVRKKNIVLIGDSHMADMSLAFKQNYPNVNIMQATLSSCPMIPGTARSEECDMFTRKIYNEISKLKNIDTIFVSAYWADQKNQQTLPKKIIDAVVYFNSNTSAKTYIIGQTKVFELSLPRTIQIMDNANINNYRSLKVDLINKTLNETLRNNNVQYIDIYNMGCNESGCKLVSDNGNPMLFDTDHLTNEWATEAIKIINSNVTF